MIDIEQELWGMTAEGEAVVLYTLRNASGAEVRITNLGAAVVNFRTTEGADLVLGYASAEDYMKDTTGLGRVVGRTAGMTKLGRITMDGTDHTLDRNAGRHHRDGGAKGFQERLWESWVENDRLAMALTSEDGDMGYPAEVNVQLIFDLGEDGGLEITYLAKSEGETIVNLTHNLAFNLAGAGLVLNHELQATASRVVEIDPMEIPTGELLAVEGTALDFMTFRKIGAGIEEPFNHVADLGGYDHTLAVDGWAKNILGAVATLRDPQSGRSIEVLSSQPALHISTLNTMAGTTPKSRSGEEFTDHAGIVLRPMNFPDALNHPAFPTTRLGAGELYCQKSVFRPAIVR